MRQSILLFLLTLWACRQPPADDSGLLQQSWRDIEAQARGTTVYFMHWQGDPYINQYLRATIVPLVDSLYDIDLQLLSGQGSQVVATVMAELEAGVPVSQVDMCWINGETFFQLRQVGGLFGPFVDLLPNSTYLDRENPFIAYDFQQPVDGMEAPWGNVQQLFIYDTAVVPLPPRNMQELADYAHAHPGTITLPGDFTGMSWLKAMLVEIAGSKEPFRGVFNEATYTTYSDSLWQYWRALKPYLWKQGTTFPDNVAQLHQLFVNGEVHLTTSMNDGEVDNKVQQGLFPESCRAYVMDAGTIRNSHYLGIVRHAGNKAGAMVVINTLLSPEAQWRKMDPLVWGDGTVLDTDRLPADWQDKFQRIPNRRYAPDRSTLDNKALQEFAPEYMIRLYEDFRKQLVEQ